MQRFLILTGDKATANGPAVYRTLYKLDEQRKAIVRQTYGAGIYSADFSADGKFIAIAAPRRRHFEREEHDLGVSRSRLYAGVPLQACGDHR
jgi:hypothetical protein